jgi:hypothetical protein
VGEGNIFNSRFVTKPQNKPHAEERKQSPIKSQSLV